MNYDPLVEEFFFNAKHSGVLDLQQKNTKCVHIGRETRSEYFALYTLWDATGKIVKASFRAYGNPYLIASLEWVCRQLEGSCVTALHYLEFRTVCKKFNMPNRHYPTAVQVEKGYNEMVQWLQENIMSATEAVKQVKNSPVRIQLSASAKRRLLSCLEQAKQYKGARLFVKKSGCSGWSYMIDYSVHFKETDLIEPINEKYNLYIDKASYPYLKGTKIDYVTDGLNAKFKFDNPNQTGLCGCGESFTVDD